MNICDLNIDSVRIIIKKQETDLFDFSNFEKAEDGFVLFTDGEVSFFKEGIPTTRLNKGDLVLLRKGDCYRFRCETGCTYITAAFTFTAASSPALEILPSILPCPKDLQLIIGRAEAAWQKQQWDRLILCRIRLLELYTELLRRCRTKHQGASARIVNGAKDYLYEHFRENFTTAEIAARCNVSTSHLRSVFEKETGTTITEFRNNLRINAAKEMLTERMFSIRETAEFLGYCDVYYFSKKFKQITGLTPARFRREQKTSE